MFIVWKKLLRLHPIMRRMSTPLTDAAKNIGKARETLHDAHEALKTDRMYINKIEQVKQHSEELIKWQEMEFNLLKQRKKIDWLRLSDGECQVQGLQSHQRVISVSSNSSAQSNLAADAHMRILQDAYRSVFYCFPRSAVPSWFPYRCKGHSMTEYAHWFCPMCRFGT
ncbi:unnamed protein product [Vicia faba]|uniref:Uncharacterized protein n=1 Tax=Vicia faba TaxID=3906 RepID=A0AAV1BE14_VICFA|nr:unnamed protein product [Vicia faba]